ncbi:MAG: carbohydrate-binding domain-containing protein [Prevotella sp.]|nr:carbohydrate-binding domain-containing protein [Prevotella sp.]
MNTIRIVACVIAVWFSALGATSQSMKVNAGSVSYVHSSAHTGDMTFTDGTKLTIEGVTYNLSDVTSMEVTSESVADNTVSVVYNGNSAAVTIAGNVARYMTASVNGAVVSIVQSADLQQEVTYTLSGSSTSGSFYMDGDYKANFVLNNLSLTSASGAAIDIEDGKALGISLVGTNSLADAAGGSHNACFYIDGHPTFSGSGSLTIAGNTKHALSVDEHMIVSSGTITVSNAVSDGFHLSEYFRMDGGTVNITAAGDGIDLGFKGESKGTKADYENNGFAFLNGGSLTISSTGDAAKGLKADSTVVVAGATVAITASGKAYYDTTEADISSSSALKTNGTFTLSSGQVTLTGTGIGGKGLNVADHIMVTGGKMTVITTGARYKYNSDLDSKPQGIKADGNINITGGEVYSAVVDSKATTFKTDHDLIVKGGTIMGVGGKTVALTTGSQNYKTYEKQSALGGSTLTKDGVSFALPAGYNNTAAFVIVSAPGM